MNLPGIVFQRFIKFAQDEGVARDPTSLRPVHPHFLLESDVLLHTRAYTRKLFCRCEFHERDIIRREKIPTRRPDMRAGLCFIATTPANKYADVSAMAFYSAVKMIKKGIDCPNHLEMLEYIWKTHHHRDATSFCLESMRIPLPPLFLFFSRQSRDC